MLTTDIIKFIGLFVALNVFVFSIYFMDKRAARYGRWRISERTLLMLAFFGGSLGRDQRPTLASPQNEKRAVSIVPAGHRRLSPPAGGGASGTGLAGTTARLSLERAVNSVSLGFHRLRQAHRRHVAIDLWIVDDRKPVDGVTVLLEEADRFSVPRVRLHHRLVETVLGDISFDLFEKSGTEAVPGENGIDPEIGNGLVQGFPRGPAGDMAVPFDDRNRQPPARAKLKNALRAAWTMASDSPIDVIARCQARSPISLKSSASPSRALRMWINATSALPRN